MIKSNFDNPPQGIARLFQENGLDSTLVLPSNIVNLGAVETKVREAVVEEDELRYHKDNLQSLEKIKKEINMITGEVNA